MLQNIEMNFISDFQISIQNINPLTTIYSSLECIYYYMGINSDKYFYITIVYTAILPFIKGIIINFFRLIFWEFRITEKRKAILYLTFVCLYIVDLPTTLNGVIALVNCQHLGQYYYVVTHMDTQCFNTENYWIMFSLVFLLSIIFWTILVPLLILYLHKKHKIDNRELHVRISIGAFSIEYKDEKWYFGLLSILLKSMLIIIANLSFIDPKSRGLFGILIIYGYRHIFDKSNPMRIDSINRCESYAYSAFILLFFFAIFCYDNKDPFLFIFGLICNILINIWIFCYILVKLGSNFKASLKSKIKAFLLKRNIRHENKSINESLL